MERSERSRTDGGGRHGEEGVFRWKGFGGFLRIAKGSERERSLIHFIYCVVHQLLSLKKRKYNQICCGLS